jgi:hypothetical protein
MTLARRIAELIRSEEARGRYVCLETIRIVRARTRNGRTEVLALGSGEWLECHSLEQIVVQ